LARRISERAQAVAFVAILVAAIVGIYAVAQSYGAPSVPASRVRSIHLAIEGDNWAISYVSSDTENNTAFGILHEASDRLGFALVYRSYDVPPGILVLGINGSMNGEGGRYWLYWVNGVYGTVAADRQALRDGDTVLWRFSDRYEG
jgi:hypothetical protein